MVQIEAPERRVWTLERPGKISLIQGWAAIYYERFGGHEGSVHRVLPGAFDKALESTDEVFACVNHDLQYMPLGSSTQGTLVLESVEIGLKVTIYPPQADHAHNIIEVINREKADMSFAWVTMKANWTEVPDAGPDGYIRDLVEVNLFSVSVLSQLLGDRR